MAMRWGWFDRVFSSTTNVVSALLMIPVRSLPIGLRAAHL